MSEEILQIREFLLTHKILHWASAVLIFGMLCVGFYMEGKYELYAMHKSFGIIVLALTFVRVLVLVAKGRPASVSTHKKWEKALAHIVHGLLYVFLIVMPVSGWIMSNAGGHSVELFGMGLPDIVSKDAALSHAGHEVHEIVAWLLMVAIGLHIAGALKHYFIDRDVTMRRISWEWVRPVHVVLLCVLLVGAYGFIGASVWHAEAMEHSHEG